ncbi:MAG: DUF1588 domain-containing protein [Myxococcales bacterium]|nr:DUF1588 domain-containing protein [Myxococcales bacterium]
MSTELVGAFIDDAEQLAELLVDRDRVAAFAGCAGAASFDAECARSFVRELGLRAWRRPLADEEVGALMTTFERERSEGSRYALESVVTRLLSAPQFLYRVELGDVSRDDGRVRPLTSYELASRLSFFYRGGPPDEELLDAARRGVLDDPSALRSQVRRLVFGPDGDLDPRSRAQLDSFLATVAGQDAIATYARGPGLDQELGPLLGEEVRRLIEHVVFVEGGHLPDALHTGYALVNGPLAEHYGLVGPTGDEFEIVPNDRHVGLLTQGGPLVAAGHGVNPSIVMRGVFILERFACVLFPPPPPEALELAANLPPELTPRERVELHSEAPACAGCHRLIDPVGIALSHFDGLGRFSERYVDGEPIDATARLEGFDFEGPISGAGDLAASLAASEDVAACASAWIFRFAHGRIPGDVDACTIEHTLRAGDSLVDQWLAVGAMSSFRFIPSPEAS